jgi:hypothetical protein
LVHTFAEVGGDAHRGKSLITHLVTRAVDHLTLLSIITGKKREREGKREGEDGETCAKRDKRVHRGSHRGLHRGSHRGGGGKKRERRHH